jgi:TM2 domain-containing membrane protein YozV
MGKDKKIKIFVIIIFSIFCSLIFEKVLSMKLPNLDDTYLYVTYIVKNLYVMLNIAIAVCAYLKK